jgi:hypothetical protein
MIDLDPERELTRIVVYHIDRIRREVSPGVRPIEIDQRRLLVLRET